MKRERTEISPVPLKLSNAELEGLADRALSVTGNDVNPDDLEACHHFKKRVNVIIKFKSRKLKHKIINNWKTMKNNSKELNELKFSNNLYIPESMCVMVCFSNVENYKKLKKFSTHGS